MEEMEDLTVEKSSKRKEIKQQLLGHLQKFEDEDWEIFGWHTMALSRTHWLGVPEKLKNCQYYQVIKTWLENGIVVPRRSTPEGLVRYEGLESFASNAFVESIFFCFWFGKDDRICIISYGEHKYINNEIFEENLGGAGYSIVFKDWNEILPRLLAIESRRGE